MVRLFAGGGAFAALGLVLLFSINWSSPDPTNDIPFSRGQATEVNARTASSGQTEAELGQRPPPAPIRMRSGQAENDEGVAPQPAKTSLAVAFHGEAIDPEIAGKRSKMIREVVEGLVEASVGSGRITELECRTRHCVLRISGDDHNSVVSLVDALQDERGFLGKAESLMLSRDEEGIRIHLRFPK